MERATLGRRNQNESHGSTQIAFIASFSAERNSSSHSYSKSACDANFYFFNNPASHWHYHLTHRAERAGKYFQIDFSTVMCNLIWSWTREARRENIFRSLFRFSFVWFECQMQMLVYSEIVYYFSIILEVREYLMLLLWGNVSYLSTASKFISLFTGMFPSSLHIAFTARQGFTFDLASIHRDCIQRRYSKNQYHSLSSSLSILKVNTKAKYLLIYWKTMNPYLRIIIPELCLSYESALLHFRY